MKLRLNFRFNWLLADLFGGWNVGTSNYNLLSRSVFERNNRHSRDNCENRDHLRNRQRPSSWPKPRIIADVAQASRRRPRSFIRHLGGEFVLQRARELTCFLN